MSAVSKRGRIVLTGGSTANAGGPDARLWNGYSTQAAKRYPAYSAAWDAIEAWNKAGKEEDLDAVLARATGLSREDAGKLDAEAAWQADWQHKLCLYIGEKVNDGGESGHE